MKSVEVQDVDAVPSDQKISPSGSGQLQIGRSEFVYWLERQRGITRDGGNLVADSSAAGTLQWSEGTDE